jgi:two-component system, OmpR family, response regulator
MRDVNIFIVDDDKMQCELLKDYLLKNHNYKIDIFHTGEDCINHLNENPEIIFLDYNLSSVDKNAKNGMQILRSIKHKHPAAEVVMFTAQDKIEIAIDTLTHGAFDYIIKNESAFHRADNVVTNILKKHKLEKQNKFYKNMLIAMGIIIGVLTVVAVTLYQTGHITDNVGADF